MSYRAQLLFHHIQEIKKLKFFQGSLVPGAFVGAMVWDYQKREEHKKITLPVPSSQEQNCSLERIASAIVAAWIEYFKFLTIGGASSGALTIAWYFLSKKIPPALVAHVAVSTALLSHGVFKKLSAEAKNCSEINPEPRNVPKLHPEVPLDFRAQYSKIKCKISTCS